MLEHPEKSSGAGEDLEHKSDDEPLGELALFSLDKRRQSLRRRPYHSLKLPERRLQSHRGWPLLPGSQQDEGTVLSNTRGGSGWTLRRASSQKG